MKLPHYFFLFFLICLAPTASAEVIIGPGTIISGGEGSGYNVSFEEDYTFEDLIITNHTISFYDGSSWSNLTIDTSIATDETDVEIRDYEIAYPDNYQFNVLSQGHLNISLNASLNNTEYAIKTDGLFDSFIFSDDSSSIIYDNSSYSSSSVTKQFLPAYVELIYPEDNYVTNVSYPPITTSITFKWTDVGADKYKITIADDVSFYLGVSETIVLTNYTTISIENGQHYWKVVPFFETSGWGSISPIYDFSLNVAASNVTAVQGIVYDNSGGASSPISGAEVTIYNTSEYGTTIWQDSYIVGTNGYYLFDNIINGTYYITASKAGYITPSTKTISVTTNGTLTHNILMQPESGEGVYYSPHYVRFIVTDSWYWERYVGATVNVYIGESTTISYTGTTGTDGAIGFQLSENIKYRIVTTYDDITQTDYIIPTESTYYIVLEETETNLLPDSQFYDVININITKDEINSTYAKIDIDYIDYEDSTNSVYFVIGQTYNNGTLNVLDTSNTYTGNCSVTFNITGYLGQSYIIKAVVDHGEFGAVTKYFSVDFPSNNLPFTGKGVVYLCILVLFVVAAQFGKADNTQGAILLCGLTWFMYAMDIFLTFGESVNTLIGVGLGISTAYALLAYINKKRNEEGI